MRREAIVEPLSDWAPTIVWITLLAALVADWLNTPVLLPRGLAILVGGLAVILFGASGRRQLESEDGESVDGGMSWLAYELSGKGTPPGFYPLGFFGIVTIVLTGVNSAYSLPAWAALCLGIAWGKAKASYSSNLEG